MRGLRHPLLACTACHAWFRTDEAICPAVGRGRGPELPVKFRGAMRRLQTCGENSRSRRLSSLVGAQRRRAHHQEVRGPPKNRLRNPLMAEHYTRNTESMAVHANPHGRKLTTPINVDFRIAHMRIGRLVQWGLLEKPTELTCFICGNHARQYHHFAGYKDESWKLVIPVCLSCHQKLKFALGEVTVAPKTHEQRVAMGRRSGEIRRKQFLFNHHGHRIRTDPRTGSKRCLDCKRLAGQERRKRLREIAAQQPQLPLS